MEHKEYNWQAFDSLNLYAQEWKPEGESKAVICLVHGLGEHSGRYQHVAQFFIENGYAVLTFDLRGHGKSGGERGHADSFDSFLKDIDLLIQESEQRYPERPRFLYGHSLGGILVLNYTLARQPQINGVVATSAGLRTALHEQTLKVAFAKLAGTILPGVTMATGLDAEQISRDPVVVETYVRDPLVHDKATLAMARNTLQAIDWTFEHAGQFHLPLLLIHGTADKIAYAHGSQQFAELVKGDCTLKMWEGLFHETHNEPEQNQVMSFILDWLNNHLASD